MNERGRRRARLEHFRKHSPKVTAWRVLVRAQEAGAFDSLHYGAAANVLVRANEAGAFDDILRVPPMDGAFAIEEREKRIGLIRERVRDLIGFTEDVHIDYHDGTERIGSFLYHTWPSVEFFVGGYDGR